MPDFTVENTLHRLLYVSRVADVFRQRFEADMARIVALSEVNNRRRDVTGVLVSHEGWFVQALEGRREVILELYNHIAADPRHEAVQLVSLEPARERIFGAWGMCSGRAPPIAATQALNTSTFSNAVLLDLLSKSVGKTDADGNSWGAMASLAAIDTLPEQQFDDVVLVAKALTGADTAIIALSDGDRRWIKARMGPDMLTPSTQDRLADLVARTSGVVWIEDVCADPSLRDDAPVMQEPGLRFYAGAPLDGVDHKRGALCVLGYQPRPYDPVTASALEALARGVSARLTARREEQMAASLLSNAADAIICINDAGMITFFNPSAERMFGYAALEMVGEPLGSIVPERLRAACHDILIQLQRSGEPPFESRSVELPALRRDGCEFPVEAALAVWPDKEGVGAGIIIRDCSARKAAEKTLARAKEAAETANIAKSAFLTNMSHELRTPLNGVVGVADLLGASVLDAHQAEMVELIRSSGAQLQGLLGDILDVVRIEAGEMALTSEPFMLGHVLTSVIDLARLKAEEKRLFVELDIEAGLAPQVAGDPIRLKQILGNLVSNAIKFTESGRVTLRVRRTSDVLMEFTVLDTGIGFDPALAAQLFARFQQVDESVTRKHGGTGLGLAICRQLTELMGGHIGCDSRPGEGSTFWVSLPLRPVAIAPPDLEVESPIHAAVTRELRVLLADDHPTNRRVVELILQSLDVELTSVENGAMALEAFQLQPFDLVLMDMMMPVMDGLTATQAIRRHETLQQLDRTPVLMLTANALPEHVAAALNAGADRHVAKPINPAQLIGAIGEELMRAAANGDHAERVALA